ncbi:MAG: hypothetical protein GEV11_11380 [Streptosporangiales bacterium]|nr:hypothetical protein [Streptosporangiales bacterium]
MTSINRPLDTAPPAGATAPPAGGAAPPPADTASADRRTSRSFTALIVSAGLIMLTFGLWLGDAWPGDKVSVLLDGEPLAVWGLPPVRLIADLAAIGTVGALLTVQLLPRTDGELGETAQRALRGATRFALVWGIAGLVMLIFTFSDTSGLPFAQLPLRAFTAIDPSFPEAIPYLFGVILALVLAGAASVTERRQGALIILGLALYNLLPITTQGHGQHSPITAYSLTVHFVAVALWVGGLAGLVLYVRRSPESLAVAVPRFSQIALACFIVVALSGATQAWVNMEDPAELWRSPYGLLVAGKMTLLVALGIFGWWHRRKTVPAVVAGRSRRAFFRLAVVEVAVMAAAAALGVALSDTSTPATQVNHAAGTSSVENSNYDIIDFAKALTNP